MTTAIPTHYVKVRPRGMHIATLTPDQEADLECYANGETVFLTHGILGDGSGSGGSDTEAVYIEAIDELSRLRMVNRALESIAPEHRAALIWAYMRPGNREVYVVKHLGRLAGMVMNAVDDPSELIDLCKRISLETATTSEVAELNKIVERVRKIYHDACGAYVVALRAAYATRYKDRSVSSRPTTAPHVCRVSSVYPCPCKG